LIDLEDRTLTVTLTVTLILKEIVDELENRIENVNVGCMDSLGELRADAKLDLVEAKVITLDVTLDITLDVILTLKSLFSTNL